MKFQIFKLVLEKAEESEIKLPASAGSSKKQASFKKTSISALWTIPKPVAVWITINGGKERDGNTRPLYQSPEKSVCRADRTGHGTTDWFQIGKGVRKLYIVTLLI